MLMIELVQAVVESHYQPQSKMKLIGKSILRTLLLNAISLPFGIRTVSVSRNKSKQKIVTEIYAKFFVRFNCGAFEDRATKEKKKAYRARFMDMMDGLDQKQQIALLNLMIGSPARYNDFVSQWMLDQELASKQAG